MGKITKILTSKPLAKKIYKVPEDVISMIAMHLDQRLIIEQQKNQIAEQEAKIKEQDDYIQWTLKYCCECVVCKNMDNLENMCVIGDTEALNEPRMDAYCRACHAEHCFRCDMCSVSMPLGDANSCENGCIANIEPTIITANNYRR